VNVQLTVLLASLSHPTVFRETPRLPREPAKEQAALAVQLRQISDRRGPRKTEREHVRRLNEEHPLLHSPRFSPPAPSATPAVAADVKELPLASIDEKHAWARSLAVRLDLSEHQASAPAIG